MRYLLTLGMLLFSACATTLPEERHEKHTFPAQKVYLDQPTGKDAERKFDILGWVRTRVVFPTMEREQNDQLLCRNYYNKGARSLLKEAEKAGGDAVIEVRSVVFFLDGKFKEFKTPECSDDGAEGEILLRGVAIRFKPDPTPVPTPASN